MVFILDIHSTLLKGLYIMILDVHFKLYLLHGYILYIVHRLPVSRTLKDFH